MHPIKLRRRPTHKLRVKQGVTASARKANLHEMLRERLHGELKLDASVILEGMSLWVRELVGQRISTVGLLHLEKLEAREV